MNLLNFFRCAPLLLLVGLGCDSTATPTVDSIPSREQVSTGLYEFEALSLEGESKQLSDYSGQVTLVVNVASKCGYTPQYAGLQALHTQLADRGFAVLAFPSNEFRGQEPGDAAQIRSFCTDNYGVTFPLFEKCQTLSGDNQSPVYSYMESELGETPSWNFCKYLVGRDGKPVAFFESRVGPQDPELLSAIETALAQS